VLQCYMHDVRISKVLLGVFHVFVLRVEATNAAGIGIQACVLSGCQV
jgi:hypothetical protein